MNEQTAYLTPPQFAERLGVAVDKIYAWIQTGQLRALNVAQRANGRPRYRIPPDAIAEFEESRSTKPLIPNQRRRRRAAVATGPEYF